MNLVRTFRRNLVYFVPVLVLIGGLLLRVENPRFLQVFQLKLFDLYNQLQPRPYTDTPVVILDLDDETLKRTELQWPWPRNKLADMLALLFNAGAKVVAFDAVFPEPDRTSPKQALSIWLGQSDLEKMSPEARAFSESILQSIPDHDDVFAQIIAQIREAAKDYGVVAGIVLTSEIQGDQTPPKPKAGFAVAGDNPRPFLPAFHDSVSNLDGIDEAASGLGSFNLVPDPDGVIRRTPTMLRIGDQIYPSLAMEALRVFQGASTYILKSSGANMEASFGEHTGLNHVKVGRYEIPVDGEGRFWVHYTDNNAPRVLPLWRVFSDDFDPNLVAGKIIFFGTSAAGLKDLRTTPMNPAAAGVEVHAQVAEQVLQQHFLKRPDWADGAELIFIMAIGTVLLLLVPRFGAAAGASLGVGFIVSAWAFSWYAYREQQMLTDPLYPSLSVFAVYLSGALIRYLQTEAEREQVRGAFSQYLSPALVEQLAAEPDRLKLGGEMREMTFLFCDVRGFTTISESFKSNPQGLTRLINRMLTPLTDVILARSGTIDKYMGDCIMAFWNAPIDDPKHIEHACESSLKMFVELAELNEELEEEAQAEGRQPLPLKVGVGLNTGECVVGNMGSEQRFDYSVLGDAVNLASRLEGQSKNYGVDIVIGETTNTVAAERFATIELDLIAVKGKDEAVRIFALMGDREQKDDPGFQALCEKHNAMLAAYRAQDWDRARQLIAECRPADARLGELYDLYEERIEHYQENPPGPDWDGVFVATSK
jgi:adenylate cyclase